MADLDELADKEPWEWPADAGRRVLDVLRDQHASQPDRLRAADFAGEIVIIKDDLAEALLAIVGDAGEPDALRARAAISLGPVLEQMDVEIDAPDPDLPITTRTLRRVKDGLRQVFADASVPKEVRRRVLEGSVRAPEEWHRAATREAYASTEPEWRLTAVFCMRHVRGFDRQIVEALDEKDPDVHYEAVMAAGAWGVEGAWPHVRSLLTRPTSDKALLLAAIEASATIRPEEAPEILADFLVSEEDDIAAAAEEAVAMAEGLAGSDEDEDEDDEDDDDEGGDGAWDDEEEDEDEDEDEDIH
jgi:uncharacterized protein (UPF0147 family)